MKADDIIIADFATAKANGVNLYDKILELRKFEIENFWKRTLFFWGTIAIVLAGYIKSDLGEKYLVFISFIGLLYNLIFSLSIRGSKYWQEHWEMIAKHYEDVLKFELLSHKSDDFINEHNDENYLTYPYRFSVSKLTMLLSDITVLLWGMFWIKDIARLWRNDYVEFKFTLHNEIHWFTWAVFLFHGILSAYISWFFCKGKVFYKTKKKTNSASQTQP